MKNNRISHIDSTSPLRGKAEEGDLVVSINGKKVLDVLDYKFYAYDRQLEVVLEKKDGSRVTVSVAKPEGGDLGLDFESYLMDAPRSCANSCVFCFIDQLPPGMRPTMYFKDDDARLSFLLGNYITLTNFSEREVQRVIDLHVSPVNVSVHTTNPELRCQMLRSRNAGESLKILNRFAEGGIVMNCQIVCCPGLNDGDELLRTMRDLAALYPAVNSVSVVPVGLTKFREGLYPLTAFTPEHAAETIDLVERFGEECLRTLGSRIFFCGDELYLLCSRALPEDEFYEDYPQLDNGVGMMRLMETEFASALRLSERPDGEQSFSIATGVSAAPLFEKLVKMAEEKYDNVRGRVYPIVNDFFGHSINVSGLITGQDLLAQLRGRDLGDRLLISQNMIRREERDFLDGLTLREASEKIGVPVVATEQDGFALWDAMAGELTPEPEAVRRAEEEFYRYNT